jgi:hypothetical protein
MSPAVCNAARTVKELTDIDFEPGLLKDSHGPVFIEFYQYIDVAVVSSFSSSRRTEYRGVRYAA